MPSQRSVIRGPPKTIIKTKYASISFQKKVLDYQAPHYLWNTCVSWDSLCNFFLRLFDSFFSYSSCGRFCFCRDSFHRNFSASILRHNLLHLYTYISRMGSFGMCARKEQKRDSEDGIFYTFKLYCNIMFCLMLMGILPCRWNKWNEERNILFWNLKIAFEWTRMRQNTSIYTVSTLEVFSIPMLFIMSHGPMVSVTSQAIQTR